MPVKSDKLYAPRGGAVDRGRRAVVLARPWRQSGRPDLSRPGTPRYKPVKTYRARRCKRTPCHRPPGSPAPVASHNVNSRAPTTRSNSAMAVQPVIGEAWVGSGGLGGFGGLGSSGTGWVGTEGNAAA